MSIRSRGLCRGLARRCAVVEPRKEGIWITDDLLSLTINAFPFRQGRCGSNVPGPLEARKREAKRRNFDLAAPAVAGPFDFGKMFGRADTDAQERGSTQSENSIWQSILPGWISQKTQSHATDLPEHDAIPSPIETEDLPANNAHAAMIIKGIVRRASNIGEIRDAIQKQGLRLRFEPGLSRITFAFVLSSLRRKRNLTMTDCYEFLGDPELNAVDSKNFLLLLYDMTRSVLTKDDVFRRVRCFSDFLKLGIIPVKEIEMICQFIPMTRIAEDRLLRNDPDLMQSVFTSISKSIRKCSVLSLSDLNPIALRHCFFQLHRAKPSWGILTFAKDIIATVNPTGLRLGILSLAWTKRMAEDFSCRDSLESEIKFQTHVGFLRDLRPALPKGRFVQFIMSIAENIFLEPKFQEHRTTLVEAWAKILSKLDQDLFEMPRMIWADIGLSSPCRPANFNHAPSCQLFVRLWVCVAIGRANKTSVIREPRFERIFKSLLATFDRTSDGLDHLQILVRLHLMSEQFDVVEDVTTTHLIEQATRLELAKAKRKMGAWMKTCRYLVEESTSGDDFEIDIPDDHPRETTRRIFGRQRLRLEEMEKEIIADPEKGVILFRELDGPYTLEDMLENWALYTRTRQSSKKAFENLAKETDITDPVTVEKLILLALGGPISRSLLLKLLTYHQPLRKAISLLRGQPQRCGSRHHPEAYLNTLHALAMAFASAPYLTPSESWRLVHRIYKFIKKHGGPIRLIMSRALVQAGIHRALEEQQRVPLPRWGLASRTAGRLEGFGREKQLNNLILASLKRSEAKEVNESKATDQAA
ncbi:hypothetical protein KEM54_000879 [Ascosphaera aggregata]|nr:hypothetical protein KEM54_000879 [Ascosphaera aggregata]